MSWVLGWSTRAFVDLVLGFFGKFVILDTWDIRVLVGI